MPLNISLIDLSKHSYRSNKRRGAHHDENIHHGGPRVIHMPFIYTHLFAIDKAHDKSDQTVTTVRAVQNQQWHHFSKIRSNL